MKTKLDTLEFDIQTLSLKISDILVITIPPNTPSFLITDFKERAEKLLRDNGVENAVLILKDATISKITQE